MTAAPLATDVPPTGRSDIAEICTQEALAGDDDGFDFVAAHPVINGGLGAPCLGDVDDTLTAAWNALGSFSPPAQLDDIGVFSGFEPASDDAADTLAFVTALDDDGAQFQMSVNLEAAAFDDAELLLTLAHELTHVFTATSEQLDRSAEAIETCATYDSGDGCYVDDALMMAWIDQFWDPAVLATVDPFVDDPDAADDRCALDAGFFGAYAATNPEEDFAEAFSAFVFDLEAATPGQQERLDWIAAQPGLAEFRTLADAAGLTPLDNNFDVCG
ncbi:MAG: hypothetical protein AAFY28_19690 [Actinomycetota bacterium]